MPRHPCFKTSPSPPTPTVNEDGSTKGAFSLLVYAPNYNFPVHVYASAPTPGGKLTLPDSAYSPIALMDSISSSGTEISYEYSSRYGVPEVGSQISLKLIAISPAGVRRNPLVISGIVTAAVPPAHSDFHLPTT